MYVNNNILSTAYEISLLCVKYVLNTLQNAYL